MRWRAAVLALTGATTLGVPAWGQEAGADAEAAQPAASPDAAEAPEESAAKQRAEVHLRRGVEAFRTGQYKDAIDAFLEANAIYPSPALSFNTARAYEKMGDHTGALRFYRDYLRRSPEAEDRTKVEKRIGELEAKLQKRGVQQVTVLSEPSGATVLVDGRPVGVTPWTGELLPGTHDVSLRLRGYEDAETQFTLQAHRARDVTVELTAKPDEPVAPAPAAPTETVPAPAPASAPPSDASADQGGGIGGPLVWVPPLAVGVGALGAALGMELSSAKAESNARNARDQFQAESEVDRMEKRQLAARVLVGAGAAFTAAGVVLLVLDVTSGDEGGASEARGSAERPGVALGCTSTGCAAAIDGRF